MQYCFLKFNLGELNLVNIQNLSVLRGFFISKNIKFKNLYLKTSVRYKIKGIKPSAFGGIVRLTNFNALRF